MTRALRLPRTTLFSVRSLLLATGLSLFAPAVLPAGVPIDDGIYSGTHEALGIGDDFGRFDGTIQLVYDPDGAPADYTSSSKVLALLEEAFGYWSAVSGVSFDIVGEDANALDDRSFGNPDLRDGLVRVSWAAIGGAAGQAGPLSGFYDDNLGYFPFEDGTIELNNGAGVITSDAELVAVLVHEIGHLLGLGHSDNPDSVMYANPYNFLRNPRADDIRAVQVMYGAPATAIDVESPLPAWIYTAPPPASAATTQFLFKPNANPASGSGAYFAVDDVSITSVTSSTANSEFVWFVGAIGGSGAAIDVDATFVVVDPSGYVYDERAWELDCAANNHCVRFITIAETQVMKTIPGTWTIYVVDEAANQTLGSATLLVDTTASFNRAPVASITAVAGPLSSQATFTLTATDPEGDDVEVVWHPPNLPGSAIDVRQTFASGGSATHTINFALAGTHTFFVEVRDNAARYGDSADSSAAGEGFQTLMRVSVTLPGAALSVVSTQDDAASKQSQQTLAAVAKTTATGLVSHANGTNSLSGANVSFKYGASKDQGTTVGTIFRAGDSVIISGNVSPQPADVGKAAEIFIVIRTIVGGVHTWTYRSGAFVPWPSVSIGDLRPAYSVSSLKASEAFEIYTGNLIPAEHRIYIGYRLVGGSTLYYTGQALILNVTN